MLKFHLAADSIIGNYVITDKKVCYYNSVLYTAEEAIEFLKEHGHRPCTLGRALELMTAFNAVIKKAEEEAYAAYEEYIQDQHDQGFTTYGDFFASEDYTKQLIHLV